MDIHFIRDNAQLVKKNQKKRFLDDNMVDEILSIDEEWKNIIYTDNSLRRFKNRLNSCFKKAPKEKTIDFGDLDRAVNDLIKDFEKSIDIAILTRNQLKELSKHITEIIKQCTTRETELLKKRDSLISSLGNFVHSDVPIFKDEENNLVLKVVDSDLFLEPYNKLASHIELLEKLGMVDTENGIGIAGNRGYFFTGFGVRFNMALMQYALDFLEDHGYKLMSTPHMVNSEMMGKISQLSDFEETLYKIEGSDKYLIATSEQPMTAYFADKTLRELPVKFGGISTCYRKETGRHGNVTRGIYRVHQFEKMEQFCVTEEDKSWEMFNEMMDVSKAFYESLGISYRVVNIVSGALNNAAAMKNDLEAWFPGSKKYCELVSCTNCLDYFSKRLNTKYKNNKPVHMLNCTLCANTRTICCLVETYQTDKGFVIPEVLKPYLRGQEFVEFIY